MDDGHGRNDGLDKLGHRTGYYGDGSGSSSNLRNTHDDSDLWASRIVSCYMSMLLCTPNNHSNHQKKIVIVMMTFLKR